MGNKDFVIFIISNGRPDNLITLNTLQKSGYTGDWFIVVDDEDNTRGEYIEGYGSDKVKVFDKKRYADDVDEGNNFDNRRTTTHARNACFDIANFLGVKYFMVLDDDYVSFEFRHIEEDKLLVTKVTDLDKVIDIYLDFYINSSFKTIAFAQGGDFIGGASNPNARKRPLTRKCMNSFICSTDRPFKFIGQLNEDVNTYVTLGSRGDLFGTLPWVSLVQKQTQSQKGGMTDAYLSHGTYVKSFTTVLMMPSSVKVSMMNSNNPRLHHSIKWKNTTPMIINEKYKK